MTTIPKENGLRSAVALLQDGFTFIQNRCYRYQSDLFEIQLMGLKAVCIHGQEAAHVFYDSELFIRKGAIPKRVQKTLLGKHGVQTLDDAAHQHRKGMFMSVMTPESIQYLMDRLEDQLQVYTRKWASMDEVVLFTETQEMLCRAACAWAGIPLEESEVQKRTNDFVAMVDAFGAIGPRHWRGKRARRRTEQWIGNYIEQIRNKNLAVAEGKPAYVMA